LYQSTVGLQAKIKEQEEIQRRGVDRLKELYKEAKSCEIPCACSDQQFVCLGCSWQLSFSRLLSRSFLCFVGELVDCEHIEEYCPL
jgi:hypothetical protein